MNAIMNVLAVILLITAIGTMMLMMYHMWQTTVSDARKEEKREFEQRVEAEVERRLANELTSIQYRVKIKQPQLINESDIDWGEKEDEYEREDVIRIHRGSGNRSSNRMVSGR